MQFRQNKRYIKLTSFLIIGFLVLLFFFRKMVVNNPVFNLVSNEKQVSSWEQYLSNKEKMNLKKMKQSYAELMNMGKSYADDNQWILAREHFFLAKTLFPDRIGPRKHLCYSYLMLCQEDWRYCDRGRKELYYAMKYVQPTDKISYEYLYHLVELVEMEEIVEMEEGDALAAIF